MRTPKLTLISVMLALSLAFAGCGVCSQEAHRNDVICAVKDKVVDCTENAVVPEVLPLVLQLITAVTSADGAVDWGKVEGGLVNMGVRDGGCLLAALQDALGRVRTGAREYPQARQAASGAARTLAEKWPGVRFKLPDGRVLPAGAGP